MTGPGGLRIGRAMVSVLVAVQRAPGCTKGAAAAAAVPENQRRGYEAVNRCVRAGLLVATPATGAAYALELTAMGGSVLQYVQGSGGEP